MRGWLGAVVALAVAAAPACGSDDGGGGSAGTGGGAGSAGVNIDDLGKPCVDGKCPDGITPVSYCGIAGCPPDFCSCEIPCGGDPSVCPAGTQCVSISDGPGEVCSK